MTILALELQGIVSTIFYFICFILFLRLLTIIHFERSSTGLWAKHVYDTTRILYKYVLTLWFKGTGNGSGATEMFEGFLDEKLDKYDIVTDDYARSSITSQLIVLMQEYSK